MGGAMQNPQVTPVVAVETLVQFWATQNNCQTINSVFNFPDIFPSDNSTAELYTYTNCDCNADVKFYKLVNGGHTWPGVFVASQAAVLGNTNRDINASMELWNFFSSHSLCHATLQHDLAIEQTLVTVYPNPATSFLQLQLQPNEPFTVEITNIMAQRVLKLANQNSIDITGLTNGVYFLTVQFGQQLSTTKFIKL